MAIESSGASTVYGARPAGGEKVSPSYVESLTWPHHGISALSLGALGVVTQATLGGYSTVLARVQPVG